MFDKGIELTLKSMSSEGLTDDEAKYLRNRNAKYELVRYVYMEKMKHEGFEIKQFQFSPGDSFMDTPIIDIVNGLLKVNEAIKNGDYEVLDFGDGTELRKSNPPHSGKEKTTL
jgi:hypothetical protein